VSKKALTGIVVSNKMQKSIVVSVERTIMHPIYKKFFKIHKKFMAHDEEQQAKMGDQVRIVESMPLSAKKRWKLEKILKKAEGVEKEVGSEKEE
jgi:small subunit ribosomal protein S17